MRKLILLLIFMNTCILFAQEGEQSNEVPFHKIEKVPVFPGCKGNEKRLKKCFTKQMIKHLSKKFNADIANEVGLPPGQTRVVLMFTIDKNGTPDDFRVKAVHEALKKEGVRVLKLLPKFYPGTAEGKPVAVKYTIPMNIMVEEHEKKEN